MKRILIIDDEYNNRLLLEEILEDSEEKFQIVSAENGELGLDKLQHEKFDVVFLDMMLPVINGIQIIDIVKCQWKLDDLKVIVITGNSNKFTSKDWYYDYVDAFITKPYRSKTILDTLNKLLKTGR
ncbi:MAG: response regulator [Clostridia bacterium]|nr:response regulator [Clostridia bacterium]MDD4047787.1 response regulator [Clostridia bacterium]